MAYPATALQIRKLESQIGLLRHYAEVRGDEYGIKFWEYAAVPTNLTHRQATVLIGYLNYKYSWDVCQEYHNMLTGQGCEDAKCLLVFKKSHAWVMGWID